MSSKSTKNAESAAAVVSAPLEAAAEALTEDVESKTKTAALTKEPEKAEKKKPARKTAKAAGKTTGEKAVKTSRKPAETTTSVYVQYLGKEIVCKDVVAAIKEIWTKEMGKKEAELLDLKVYIKPEDNGAYYVLNGDATGFISL